MQNKRGRERVEEFITIEENVEAEITEKKSKFIANLFYIENIEEAEKIIKKIKKKYFDAKHNCIAYRVIEKNQIIEKSSDDGEPSGTAGQPMLSILQKNKLANVLIIVTRYFGGILLGTGGLVRAYSNSLLKAIEHAKKVTKCLGQEIRVELEYNEFENFKYYCKKNKIIITKVEYQEFIECTIALEFNKKEKLMQDYEGKKISIKKIEELSIKYISKCIE